MKQNAAVGPQSQSKTHQTRFPEIALLLLVLLVSSTVATQHFALTFEYHESLGRHYQQFYLPWSYFIWLLNWHTNYPNEFINSGIMGGIVCFIGLCLVYVVRGFRTSGLKSNATLHGSARWADKKDIAISGLLGNEGVFVGSWVDKRGKQHYLRHNGPEHVLCYAPTRSGKGVGLVVPTLLTWLESTVITDLKGELWQLTAGWRQKYAKNKVLRFEPAAPTGCIKWNPLDEIRLGTENEVGDVQTLVSLIVDPDGKGLNDHWSKSASSLLTGCILHALYKAVNEGGQASLACVDRMLSNPRLPLDQLWQEMVHYYHLPNSPHHAVSSTGQDMLDREGEELASVISTTKGYLSLYRDPVVANNTSSSEFKIKDLMNSEAAVSLYIVTKPNDKVRLRPLVRIMMNSIVRLLADEIGFENGQPKAIYQHRLLMMLDEFPSLGKLEILQESLAFLAGYGIKAYLICQDINQLKSRETGYGPDETISSNCHVQNAYPPNRPETAKHLSSLTGVTTVVSEKITTSGSRIGFHGKNSRTTQETQRPLLTEDECMRMPGPNKSAEGKITEAGDMVIYVSGTPAIYGKQPLYFKDQILVDRSQVDSPVESDILRKPIVAFGDEEGSSLY